MIKEAISDAEKRMHSAILSLQEDLAGVRTGRATPRWSKRFLLIITVRPCL
jgi:Ribosome recycling factor